MQAIIITLNSICTKNKLPRWEEMHLKQPSHSTKIRNNIEIKQRQRKYNTLKLEGTQRKVRKFPAKMGTLKKKKRSEDINSCI